MIVWTKGTRRSRPDNPVDLRQQQRARPRYDQWWAARRPDLEKIDVPALVCASFSDHNLHTHGSFEGFRRISSRQKWLYTHRGPKWAVYYSPDALDAQARFFDHFLKGEQNGQDRRPPVRLEVREDADTVTSVRYEQQWPPAATTWQRWHLRADGALGDAPTAGAEVSFRTRRGSVRFTHRFPADTEIIGPMALSLPVTAHGIDDICLFAGIRKLRGGRPAPFENAYGFRGSLVTHGIRRASHHLRAVDGTVRDDQAEPLRPGQVVTVVITLLPSATLFRAGEELQLEIQGRWFYPRNPFTGQFPAYYERSGRGRCMLHLGPDRAAHLDVPVQSGRPPHHRQPRPRPESA